MKLEFKMLGLMLLLSACKAEEAKQEEPAGHYDVMLADGTEMHDCTANGPSGLYVDIECANGDIVWSASNVRAHLLPDKK